MSDQHTSTGNPAIDAAIRSGAPLSVSSGDASVTLKQVQEMADRIANAERGIALAAAERAIVEAANQWRGDQRPKAECALVQAVDAWRKLKEKA